MREVTPNQYAEEHGIHPTTARKILNGMARDGVATRRSEKVRKHGSRLADVNGCKRYAWESRYTQTYYQIPDEEEAAK